MARPGMTRWRGKSSTAGTEGGDDVQKSLELLDKVLSEFDDIENGNLDREEGEIRTQTLRNSLAGRSESSETTGNVSSTPEDDSPSLGHQSEDDGYMSMNGKRGKFVLSFRPVPDESGNTELPPVPDPPPDPPPEEMADYPPPPEEAERIISNLLPKVSPVNSTKKLKQRFTQPRFGNSRLSSTPFGKDPDVMEMDSIAAATQTTFPKTRHQRPYGWENAINQIPLQLQFSHQPHGKYSSLPYEGALHHSRYPPPWLQKPGPLPPRTLACALDRHREVRRGNSGDVSSPIKYVNENADDNPANFSDDSLEEAVPPVNKRGSLAWEVPLGFEDDDTYLTPGSTKVIGRRRRKSTDHSSSNSIHRLRDVDDWPEPPPSTEDEAGSLYSDSYYDSNEAEDLGLPEALPLDLTFNGTYVIRKGRKERGCVNNNLGFKMTKPSNPKYEMQTGLEGGRMISKPSPDLKRASSTFDNIKSLLREELIEGLDDPPPDFSPPNPPKIVRVVSLPSLPLDDVDDVANLGEGHHRNSKCERFSKLNELGVTLEEAEDELSSLDNPSLNLDVGSPDKLFEGNDNLCNGVEGEKLNEFETSQKSIKKCNEVETQTDLSDIEAQNELEIVGKQISDISKTKSELEEVEKKIQEIVKIKTVIENEAIEEEFSDPWVKATDIELPKLVPVFEEKPPNEFHVNVEVLEHDFGPLPPSPVEENDEEYTDVFHPSSVKSSRGKGDTFSEPFYRCQDPSGSDPSGKYLNRPPEPLPHRTSDPIATNLASRIKDASFSRNQRLQYSNGARRENTAERRTLPSEFPGPVSRRRTFQKRSSTLPQENSQTSCSLPETPIFSRGCDIPRTPHRVGPDAIRPGGLQNSSYRRNGTVSNSSACNTGVSLSGGLNQALAGAELLRLAGGPGRGWYPRHRQHRPASIEQLDRITHSGTSPGNGLPGPWDIGSCRKPMTLPPNITPKFFHRSPRDALRRVTSLLIRGKGTTSKDKKEVIPPNLPPFGDAAEHCRQKKGFFRNFWKKSKHYSLDHQ